MNKIHALGLTAALAATGCEKDKNLNIPGLEFGAIISETRAVLLDTISRMRDGECEIDTDPYVTSGLRITCDWTDPDGSYHLNSCVVADLRSKTDAPCTQVGPDLNVFSGVGIDRNSSGGIQSVHASTFGVPLHETYNFKFDYSGPDRFDGELDVEHGRIRYKASISGDNLRASLGDFRSAVQRAFNLAAGEKNRRKPGSGGKRGT